jgi:hypothetical protein
VKKKKLKQVIRALIENEQITLEALELLTEVVEKHQTKLINVVTEQRKHSEKINLLEELL